MSEIDPDNLQYAIDELLSSLGQHAAIANTDAEIAPEKIDRTAKAISTCLKTLSDINAFNKGMEVSREKDRYTAYEDLPPPNAEDRRRIIEGLMARYDRLHDEAPN